LSSSSAALDRDKVLERAYKIIKDAQSKGIILRLLGATAFMTQCKKTVGLFDDLGRIITDMDFAAYAKQFKQINDLMDSYGLKLSYGTGSYGARRSIFFDQKTGLQIDIFYDSLSFCHDIYFKDRLEIDPRTIPLAEMLLQKMQIVEINEKDIKDTIILLYTFPVRDSDDKTVNGKYIANIMANDWGFYYTCTTNLKNVRDTFMKKYDLSAEMENKVTGEINTLLDMIEKQPKSFKWKLRARVGTSKKWYREIGMVDEEG